MSSTDLLSVSDCATLVRVSEDTIREYARLGFLTPEGVGDEMRFKAYELQTIFGVDRDSTNSSVNQEPVVPEAAPPDPEPITAQPFLREQIEISKPSTSKSLEEDESTENFVQRFHRMRGASLSERQDVTSNGWGTFEIRGRSEREVSSRDERMLTVINTQLNEEIRMLRDERDWLRQRLEKLEARSERDQMLLLSESENVRGLVDMHHTRRPFWLRALPWLKNSEKNDG